LKISVYITGFSSLYTQDWFVVHAVALNEINFRVSFTMQFTVSIHPHVLNGFKWNFIRLKFQGKNSAFRSCGAPKSRCIFPLLYLSNRSILTLTLDIIACMSIIQSVGEWVKQRRVGMFLVREAFIRLTALRLFHSFRCSSKVVCKFHLVQENMYSYISMVTNNLCWKKKHNC
jgi:hypothetical protein